MSRVREPHSFGLWLPAGLPYTVGDITISRLSDDHRQLVEHGEMWVPRSFMATFDRAGLPLLELGIALVDGRFRCVELQVRRREENAHLEARDLRKVKITRLVREAVRLVCYFRDELFDEESVQFARDVLTSSADLENDPIDLDSIRVGDFFRYPALAPLLDQDPDAYQAYSALAEKLAERAARGQRRRGITTDEEVAAAYKAAHRRGDNVIDEVAGNFNWQRQTAKNRIRAARAKGLLPPTTPGRRLA